jgi:hypothetical protein
MHIRLQLPAASCLQHKQLAQGKKRWECFGRRLLQQYKLHKRMLAAAVAAVYVFP